MENAKENFETIRQYLLIVFDSVVVEYDSSPVIRVWFEQNGKKILRSYLKLTHEKPMSKMNDADMRSFSKALALDIMSQFIDEGFE